MATTRCRRLTTGLMVLVATLAIASPASASASATYGTLTAVAPMAAACTGGTCMTVSSTFASNGAVSTNVTVTITLYRTAKPGATVASSTDYAVAKAGITYSTAKGAKPSWTVSAAQKCRTVATTPYGYYTRATMTNGTTAGTVTESTAIKQLKGCLTG